MKKILLISFCIFLIINRLQAQDLIITSDGDSINCTITKITKDYIYFTFKHNSEIRNTLLRLDQVIVQEKNYFVESEIPVNYVFKAKFPRFRVAIDGGWQYRLAKIASGLDPYWKEHYTKMRPGFHYDIQAACFFVENHGIEVLFSQQFFGNKLRDMFLVDDAGNVVAVGILNEKITFNYVGANYIVRFFNAKKKNCFLMTVGLGYLGYVDKLFFNNEEYGEITAATVGVNLGLGYDIAISKYFSIGFKASLMSGSFRTYKQTFAGVTTTETMPEKSSEGLGTIKLSVGLRFNK